LLEGSGFKSASGIEGWFSGFEGTFPGFDVAGGRGVGREGLGVLDSGTGVRCTVGFIVSGATGGLVDISGFTVVGLLVGAEVDPPVSGVAGIVGLDVFSGKTGGDVVAATVGARVGFEVDSSSGGLVVGLTVRKGFGVGDGDASV